MDQSNHTVHSGLQYCMVFNFMMYCIVYGIVLCSCILICLHILLLYLFVVCYIYVVCHHKICAIKKYVAEFVEST